MAGYTFLNHTWDNTQSPDPYFSRNRTNGTLRMFFSKGKTETYAGSFVDQKLVRGVFAVSAHGQ